jgi:hypothetical protein
VLVEFQICEGQPHYRIVLDERIDISRDRFLNVDDGLGVLLTSLLDLSFEFVEVLRGYFSDCLALVVVDNHHSSRVSYRTDESKEEIAASRNCDRVGETLLKRIGGSFDSFH